MISNVDEFDNFQPIGEYTILYPLYPLLMFLSLIWQSTCFWMIIIIIIFISFTCLLVIDKSMCIFVHFLICYWYMYVWFKNLWIFMLVWCAYISMQIYNYIMYCSNKMPNQIFSWSNFYWFVYCISINIWSYLIFFLVIKYA